MSSVYYLVIPATRSKSGIHQIWNCACCVHSQMQTVPETGNTTTLSLFEYKPDSHSCLPEHIQPISDSLITNDDRTRSQLSFFSCYVCGTHLRSSWMRKACRQALSDLYFSRLTEYLLLFSGVLKTSVEGSQEVS